MNLTIQREALLKPLQLVIGVVERKQTLPILSNILLVAEENNLSIKATDLEVEVIGRSTFDEKVEEAVRLTLPGRKLLDICRALPDQSIIQIVKDKDRIILRSGRSRFILTTFPVTDFPEVPPAQADLEFAIGQMQLRELLQRTHFSMAQQDVRYYLNGMLWEVNEKKIRAVATDGHRLALNTILAPEVDSGFMQIIVPRKGVLELMRLLDNSDGSVKVTLGSNHLRLDGNDFTFTSKLIDGRFPDYEKVLPKNCDKNATVEREAFKEALIRASILTNEKVKGVRLHLRAGLLRILANNPEQEEAEEIITTDYQGEDLDVGFNVDYLLEILQTVSSEKIRFNFVNSMSGVQIEEVGGDGNSWFVIMPLRL